MKRGRAYNGWQPKSPMEIAAEAVSGARGKRRAAGFLSLASNWSK
jgi:hypothetical protein